MKLWREVRVQAMRRAQEMLGEAVVFGRCRHYTPKGWGGLRLEGCRSDRACECVLGVFERCLHRAVRIVGRRISGRKTEVGVIYAPRCYVSVEVRRAR